jgi:ABC-type glycerol-3-phosphate transport system substrate-binding protein
LTGNQRRIFRTLAGPVIFLAGLILVCQFASCTRKRAPGPLRIWVDLTEEEAAVFRELLSDMKSFKEIETALELKPLDEILKNFDSPHLEKLHVPDLVEVDIYHLEQARKRVADLTPFTYDTLEVKSFYPSGIKPGTSGRNLYFLPYRFAWPVMVYNCDEVSGPPGSWDELIEFGNSNPGEIGLAGLSDETLVLEIISWIWQAGGDPYYISHPRTREAFYFLKKLGPIINMSSRAYRSDSLMEAQRTGEISIHFNGPDQLRSTVMGTGQSPLQGGARSGICTAPMPEGPESAQVAVTARYLSIPLTSRHPKEAVECMRFLTTIRVQSALAERLLWVPVRGDAWPVYKKRDQARLMQGFMRSVQNGVGINARKNFHDTSRLLIEAYQKIVFDQEPVEDTLWEYQRRMEDFVE